jgi:hypothetical protein
VLERFLKPSKNSQKQTESKRKTQSMRSKISKATFFLAFVLTIGVAALPNAAQAQDNTLPKYLRESDHRPEVFSYLEMTTPSHKQSEKVFSDCNRPRLQLIHN